MKFKLEEIGAMTDFEAMYKAFPEIPARLLGYLGKTAAVELRDMMRRGQRGVKFRDMDENRRRDGGSGRRMITYSVGRGLRFVRISSFPLNLFEGGRTLRSGKREAARNIIRGSLAGVMRSRMSGAVDEAQKLIVDEWFNDRPKGGLKKDDLKKRFK